MSGETCQFCGAGGLHTSDGRLSCYCGSSFSKDGGAYQSRSCEERQRERNSSDLARFRTMFPTIMPDDPREITAEICEALGMRFVSNLNRFLFDGLVVDLYDDYPQCTFIHGHRQLKRAGQLACLIAARRNVEAT